MGGYDNEVQSNNGGVFGGDHNLVHSSADIGGVFGGKQNEAFDGYIFGGQLNVNRGQQNVIVGGRENELLYDFGDENNLGGDYNRWSVILGGSGTQVQPWANDFTTVIGLWNKTFIGTPYTWDMPNDNLHIQVGPVNE